MSSTDRFTGGPDGPAIRIRLVHKRRWLPVPVGPVIPHNSIFVDACCRFLRWAAAATFASGPMEDIDVLGRLQSRRRKIRAFSLIVLGVGVILVAGCGRDARKDAPEVGPDDAANTVDSSPEIQRLGGEVHWTKGNERCAVYLNDIAADDLPVVVAATLSLPGVEEVRMTGAQVGDTAALPIVGIPTLRRLRLTDTSITDATIAKVSQQGNLQLLHLHGAPDVTSEGMSAIESLTAMKDLSLSGKNFDDRVLPALTAMSQLKKLRLRGSGVTGDSFESIATLPVVDLELAETDFGNQGMPWIAKMPKLTKLNLWLCKVDDAGVIALDGMTQLTSLNLDNLPGVTDASIDTIVGLSELTFLHLGKTSVSPEGVARLTKLQELETLHVTNLDVPDDVLETLREEMPNLKSLVN